jgi:SAM-dependent methyltransferase
VIAQAAAFDRIAREYSRLWDESAVGRLQRDAVWRYLGPLLRPGDRILDLGCGTGEDGLRFARLGVNVLAIDASADMARVAVERGVNAWHCRIEDLDRIGSRFDGAVSNFGALNCVEDLSGVRNDLSRLIAPGGYLAVCLMGRVCFWETVWYLLRGDTVRAFRRWKGSAESSLGLTVRYPLSRDVVRAFLPEFRLMETAGIGIFVPPSFVPPLPPALLNVLDRIDRRIAGWPLFAAAADHRIFIFRRN